MATRRPEGHAPDLPARELRRENTARCQFGVNPPVTKEAYLYRELFDSHFPQPDAVATVPGGPSIACSTPTAIAWEASFAANADLSGRAVASVHQQPKYSTAQKWSNT